MAAIVKCSPTFGVQSTEYFLVQSCFGEAGIIERQPFPASLASRRGHPSVVANRVGWKWRVAFRPRWACFRYSFPHLQLEAGDLTVLREGKTTSVKCLKFLNHHFPLIGKSTTDCYTSKNQDCLKSLKYGSSFGAAANVTLTQTAFYMPRSHNVRFPPPVKESTPTSLAH